MAIEFEQRQLQTTTMNYPALVNSNTSSTGASAIQGEKVVRNILGDVINGAVDIGFAAFDYHSYRKQGDGVLKAGIKTAGNLAIGVLLPWQVQIPLALAQGVSSSLPDLMMAANQTANTTNQAYLGTFGGGYQTSQMAATMRQAGVEAIQNNGLNVRSVLGSEARMYERTVY